MNAVSSARMQRIDRLAITHLGIPILLLMDNAGRHVAEYSRAFIEKRGGRRITVLAGGGSNGGDGVAAARYLQGWGFKVTVYWMKNPALWTGDLAVHYQIAKRSGVSFMAFARVLARRRIQALRGADLLIDALLGTGTQGHLKLPYYDAIHAMNLSRKPIIAVDLPSGLDPDSGQAEDIAIKAAATITMAAPKTGLIKPRSQVYVGKLIVADIGIPYTLLKS